MRAFVFKDMDENLQRAFGYTGLTVSALGFGAGQLGNAALPDRDAQRIVDLAVDLGVTLFDTARGYGVSEARLARFLKPHRQRVVISTKVGYGVAGVPDWTAGAVTAGVDEALRKLETDCIEIVHLHSCGLDVLRRGEVTEALDAARRAGKLRVAAYSGENEALAFAIDCGQFQAVQTSVNLADQRGLERDLPRAVEKGLGIIAKRPVANAPWRFETRPYGHYAEEYWHRWRTMDVDPHGLDWQELALRFAVFAPGVHTSIVGTTDPEHLRLNAAAVSKGPLPADQVEAIRRAFRAHDEDWEGLT
jgi:aryl-alcohol dehydrogenase-like predicted oxidoreductase